MHATICQAKNATSVFIQYLICIICSVFLSTVLDLKKVTNFDTCASTCVPSLLFMQSPFTQIQLCIYSIHLSCKNQGKQSMH